MPFQEFLTRTRAIVFLDGIDEVALDHRAKLKDQIQQLARRLSSSKVVLSCRSRRLQPHLLRDFH